MTMPVRHGRQRGFTLVEAILVIVITAIVGTMVAVFIKTPVKSYADTVSRAAASDEADLALRRLARDLRLALPNSVRVSPDGYHLEFLETKVGLRYQAEDDVDPSLNPAQYLSWNTSATTFRVIGTMPTGRLAPQRLDYLVVYNLGAGQAPADAYGCSLGACNLAQIDSVGANTLTMVSNPFPAQVSAPDSVAMMSPGKRVHVVTGPVSYHCNPVTGALRRHWNYPITAAQAMPPTAGSNALLASNVSACSFSYDSQQTRRSGLVLIKLTLRIPASSDGKLTLVHQVHVNNTP